MDIVTKMKKDWDRRASHHARYWIATEDYRDEAAFQVSGEDTAAAILNSLSSFDVAGWRALEIGCGIGRVLKPLASHLSELVGVDVSGKMIAESKTWLAGLSNVKTFENSGVDLGFLETETFDLVISYIAFQHMPLPVFIRYLEESQRVLRPGGHLLFQIYVGPTRDLPLADTISLRVYEEGALTRLLEKTGFTPVSSTTEHRTARGLESRLVLARRENSRDSTSDRSWLDAHCDDYRSPMDDHLYRTLAHNYLADGDGLRAIATLRAQVEHNPGSLGAWLELAALLVEQGQRDEAIDVLKCVNELHPDHTDAFRSRAQLLATAGRFAEAVDALPRGVK